MKPKLIIFDLFGTLVFPIEKLKKDKYFSFYKSLGIELKTPEDIKMFTDIFTHLMNFAENWRDFSQKLLEKVMRITDQKTSDKLSNFFEENIVYQVYEDVKDVINLPCQKAILTAAAKFLFSNLELEKYFKVFTPKETRFLKPDIRTFSAVLEKFNVLPEETVMIGDEIERDLIPAKKLGMESILIDRDNKIKNTSFQKISSLRELKKII